MKCVIPEKCNGPVVRFLSQNSKGPEIDSDRGISRVRILVALDICPTTIPGPAW